MIDPTVLEDIAAERVRQDETHDNEHDPLLQRALPVWVTVLTEEVGEFAQSVLELRYRIARIDALGKQLSETASPGTRAMMAFEHERLLEERGAARAELVQIAAVAIAVIERIDKDPLTRE